MLAGLLTTIDFEECLLRVRPREFVCLAWMHKQKKHMHPDFQGARNVCRWIANSNQRVSWVGHEIINYGGLVGPAFEALEYFIRVCRSCLRRNNLCAAFEIVAALTLPAVKRLDGWGNVAHSKKQLLTEMAEMVSANDNYAQYRKAVAHAHGSPHIPALQVMVRDIAGIENSCPWTRGDEINIRKLVQLETTACSFLASQNRMYTILLYPTDTEEAPQVKRSPGRRAWSMFSATAPGHIEEHVAKLQRFVSQNSRGPFVLHSDLKLLQFLQGAIQTYGVNALSVHLTNRSKRHSSQLSVCSAAQIRAWSACGELL
jgi:hypothetical protein